MPATAKSARRRPVAAASDRRKGLPEPSPTAPNAAQMHKEALAALAVPRTRAAIARRLLAWYAANARDLPWRRSRDPYRVWVSEIMLQQTVVATVIPYFERFLARFPTVTALAKAPEEDVLRLWEGLGYYRRARQLHRAADVVCAEHDGRFPRDAQAVRALPGIGRYTAGAILSIAFDQPQPILEANTIRLLARLIAYSGDTHSTAGQRLLWETAEQLLPRREVGRFNQALMELGSQVCTPREPRCDACPLAALCPTRRWQLADRIPAQRARPVIELVREAAVVVRRGDKVLIVRRQPGERWAGLWDFPRFALSSEAAAPLDEQLVAGVTDRAGVKVRPGELLTTIRHSVTRFRISLECYEAVHIAKASRAAGEPETRWVRPSDLGEFPLSTSARKLARLLAKS
jgi:A/G-specific adenine glycosylase